MTEKIFDSFITPDGDGGFWLELVGEYGQDSVLEGESFTRKAEHFDSLAEAQAQHPQADILEHSPADLIRVFSGGHTMPDTPPDWFDASIAGEAW